VDWGASVEAASPKGGRFLRILVVQGIRFACNFGLKSALPRTRGLGCKCRGSFTKGGKVLADFGGAPPFSDYVNIPF
jgi:hypothetical protein